DVFSSDLSASQRDAAQAGGICRGSACPAVPAAGQAAALESCQAAAEFSICSPTQFFSWIAAVQQFGRLYNSARVRNSLWSQPGVRPVVMCIVLHFSDAATANFPVAGIPAAARAVHQIALAAEEGRHIGRCIVAVPGGWVPNAWCREEMARLAPQFDVLFEDFDGIRAAAGTLYLKGEDLLPARTITSLLQGPSELPRAALRVTPSLVEVLGDLRRKGDAIITATAKASDGIVSRHFNRPISRLISRMLLRVRGVKPVHAT